MGFSDWAANNLSLGGLVKNIGAASGSVVNYTAKGVGLMAEAAAEACGSDVGSSIRKGCNSVGEAADSALTDGSKVLGQGVNVAVDAVGRGTGYVAAEVAEACGAEASTVELTRKVGNVVGAGACGLVAGMGVANAAVSIAAASGTAGAAATTSGLAALGGGSVAAGGGGMAAGQVVVNTITASMAASGTLSQKDD